MTTASSCSGGLSPERLARRTRLIRLAANHGITLAPHAVCRGHCTPLDWLEAMIFDRPRRTLLWGPRGGSKSLSGGFAVHLLSILTTGHGTKILGGSEAQSQQIFGALKQFETAPATGDWTPIRDLRAKSATYANGSEVSYIPASRRSVRGPHVPLLLLDEVDEIDAEILESAMGMAMSIRGTSTAVAAMSTYHRVGGNMASFVERAEAGAFDLYPFCVFDVLEPCPPERSGPDLEKCPACPIMPWCHSDRADHGGLPKAKRSSGHYSIDDVCDKTMLVSRATFESDYLSLRPQAAGKWFTMFDPAVHVDEKVAFNPNLPVHIAVDVGVHCGAVLLQRRDRLNGMGPEVTVIGDWFLETSESEVAPVEANARGIMGVAMQVCPGAQWRVSMDRAGSAREKAGPVVRGEFIKAGLKSTRGGEIEPWSQGKGSVAESLELLATMLRSADGTVSLKIHPRCRHLISALETYRREKKDGMWTDRPEELQHPAGELIDSLRCALKLEMPEGHTPAPKLRTYRFSGVG
jgi:hypothetical protein